MVSHSFILNHSSARDPPTFSERLNPVEGAAFDEGGARASKCMPGTRVDIIAKIKAWAYGTPRGSICWVNAAAGFGKSAIARTIAEWCAEQGILGSSYFFLRGSGDRSNISSLVPTLAYHLSQSFPSTKSFIEKQLKEEPNIIRQPAAFQFQKLLVDPFRLSTRTFLPFTLRNPVAVIIIDALDECDDRVLMAEFVEAVITAGKSWPFRILFTGRTDEHLRQIFQMKAAQSVTYSLSLHDFIADKDIRMFYCEMFGDIYARNRDMDMRTVPSPWPTYQDLSLLVNNTAGVFNFASTVVAFINDGSDLPHFQLQKVLKHHDGLDPVYTHILSVAAHNKDFDTVLGTLMLLVCPLSVKSLATLLRLDPARIVHSLKGLQSILIIPKDDDNSIRPIHTSLRDFLTSLERSNNLYIRPKKRHFDIAIDCLRILCVPDSGPFFDTECSALRYASCLWICHLHSSMRTEMRDDSLIPLLIGFTSNNFNVWVNTILSVKKDTKLIYNEIDGLVSSSTPYFLYIK